MTLSSHGRQLLPLLASFVVATLLIVTVVATAPLGLTSVSRQSGSTSSTSSTAGFSSPSGMARSTLDKLNSSFATHMARIASRHVSAIINHYETTDTVTW